MARREREDRRLAAALGVMAVAVTAAVASAEGAALDRQSVVSDCPASPGLNGVQVGTAPARGVRPLGREAERLLAEARRLSPTVRRLLAELEASDLFVYVEVRPVLPSRTAQLALLGSGAGVRYLKIKIHRNNVGGAGISWLAHELQHAVEIASAPDVTDEAGFVRLYRRIGHRNSSGPGESFETDAAIEVGNQVLAELASAPSTLTARRVPR
jgi:hypothetical protein